MEIKIYTLLSAISPSTFFEIHLKAHVCIMLITVSKDSGNGFNSPVTTDTFFSTVAFYKIIHFKPVSQNSLFVTSHNFLRQRFQAAIQRFAQK